MRIHNEISQSTKESVFPISIWRHAAIAAFFAAATVSPAAGNLQLISARNPSLSAPAAGNGDSDLPIVNADGRYVLFDSVANNLVTNRSSGPVSGLQPRTLNVFVRDRANGTNQQLFYRLLRTQ